jgi:hypothetical protein
MYSNGNEIGTCLGNNTLLFADDLVLLSDLGDY